MSQNLSYKITRPSKIKKKPKLSLSMIILLLFFNFNTFAKPTNPTHQIDKTNTTNLTKKAQPNKERIYTSKDDEAITIEKIYFENFTDNMNNIYSQKAQERIISLFTEEPQWEMVTDPKQADIQVSSRLTKNPKTISIRLSFSYTKKTDTGNTDLTFSDSVDLENVFEMEKILLSYENLFYSLKKRIPYQGVILSRSQDQVTLSLGKKQGLLENQDVIAILITKIKKHPKTNFYISAEKEILGKIQITKVDEALSFGKILYERTENSIQKNTKVEFSKLDLRLTQENPDMKNRPDSPIVIGKSPQQEWLPTESPQFGKVSITGGLIQYTHNLNFLSAGSKTVGQWLTPTIKAAGELWINPEFHLELFLRQSSFKVSNPLEGSEPGSVNTSLSQYQVKAKYNYTLDSSFRSPQFQASIGMGQFTASFDTTAPVSLSTHSFGGILIGFNGQFPISEEIPVDLGLYFNYFLTKSLSDSAAAESSGVQINDFGLLLRYLKSQKLSYIFDLSFEYYASDFNSSTGTRADPINGSTHRLMTTMAGIEYSF